MINVGSTGNVNNAGAGGSTNKRDDKGAGRGSYKSASPAPEKLQKKEGKFVSDFGLVVC